jgi:hypothetical protein
VNAWCGRGAATAKRENGATRYPESERVDGDDARRADQRKPTADDPH